MNILFDKVMPIPLASIAHSSESIWGNQVSFNSGEKILLNASSGKGKSTFTLSSVGLRSDYEGTIRYEGKDIKMHSHDEWTKIRREQVAVVFQDLQLFPTLTVGENLMLKSELKPLFNEVQIIDFLNHLAIADKWNQKCALLSMGQQQRVAIIRALIQPFQWLIMDEPFSHLDKENTQKCLELIHQRCDEQKAGFILTTLGETHDTHFDKELKL